MLPQSRQEAVSPTPALGCQWAGRDETRPRTRSRGTAGPLQDEPADSASPSRGGIEGGGRRRRSHTARLSIETGSWTTKSFDSVLGTQRRCHPSQQEAQLFSEGWDGQRRALTQATKRRVTSWSSVASSDWRPERPLGPARVPRSGSSWRDAPFVGGVLLDLGVLPWRVSSPGRARCLLQASTNLGPGRRFSRCPLPEPVSRPEELKQGAGARSTVSTTTSAPRRYGVFDALLWGCWRIWCSPSLVFP